MTGFPKFWILHSMPEWEGSILIPKVMYFKLHTWIVKPNWIPNYRRTIWFRQMEELPILVNSATLPQKGRFATLQRYLPRFFRNTTLQNTKFQKEIEIPSQKNLLNKTSLQLNDPNHQPQSFIQVYYLFLFLIYSLVLFLLLISNGFIIFYLEC